MESTGKYWIPIFNLLEDKINVTIANPKWVKAVKGNKGDTKDYMFFFALVMFPAALYLVKIYAFFVNTLATVLN